jgi:hypothetical protein
MRKLIRMIYTMLKERKEWKQENTALAESKVSRLDGDWIRTFRSMESAAWLSVI